ncbi:hypothetical protein D3C84_1055220 [compost metagenome]
MQVWVFGVALDRFGQAFNQRLQLGFRGRLGQLCPVTPAGVALALLPLKISEQRYIRPGVALVAVGSEQFSKYIRNDA